jgi:hypothetical protein
MKYNNSDVYCKTLLKGWEVCIFVNKGEWKIYKFTLIAS